VFKHYKKYFESSRKQTQYLKDNFSFNKMVEKINTFMPIPKPTPKNVDVKLPKLKKIGDNLEQKKTELPKLKKVH
jgi:hypothetical protein